MKRVRSFRPIVPGIVPGSFPRLPQTKSQDHPRVASTLASSSSRSRTSHDLKSRKEQRPRGDTPMTI